MEEGSEKKNDSAGVKELIDSIEKSRDEHCLSLGERWFTLSGALELKESAANSYDDYVEEKDKVDSSEDEDFDQIRKDVLDGRTNAVSFGEESLAKFWEVDDDEQDKRNQIIYRILTAYVVRNRDIGYAQGMNFITLILLSFMEEEQVFWTLCQIVENLRLRDFYSKPPAMMNGYIVETSVMADLMKEKFPKIKDHLTDETFANIVQMLGPKWLIPLFVDTMPLKENLRVLDAFFCEGGDIALFRTAMVIMKSCKSKLLEVEEPTMAYPILLKGTTAIQIEQLHDGLSSEEFEVSHQKVDELQNFYVEKIRKKWSSDSHALKHLGKSTQFNMNQLEALRFQFSQFCHNNLDSADAIPKKEFFLIFERLESSFDRESIAKIFQFIDFDSSGDIDFRELMCLLSTLTLGSIEDRMKLCFSTYDKDSSGFLDDEELTEMCTALLKMTYAEHPVTDDEVEKLKSKFLVMDANSDGQISFSEFYDGVSTEPEFLSAFSLNAKAVDNAVENYKQYKDSMPKDAELKEDLLKKDDNGTTRSGAGTKNGRDDTSESNCCSGCTMM